MLETVSLYKSASCGNYGDFAIEIRVAATKLPDLGHETINFAAYHAAKQVHDAIMTEVIRNDPQSQAYAADQRDLFLGLFKDTAIYVEEIPNGYCPDWCCKHLPWFIVTTTVGRIKIGSRKHVIAIDWSDTRGTKTAEELFKAEDVTKDTRMIHAWHIEKAQSYITAILQSAAPAPQLNPSVV